MHSSQAEVPQPGSCAFRHEIGGGGKRGDVPVCVCLIVLLFPRMGFHMPLCPSLPLACRRSSQLLRSLAVSGCATVAFEAAVASRADRLLVPISGYRVPSLKLIATPLFRILGQPTSWPAMFSSRSANWLDPSLTPPLTLHGFASHHPKTIAYYYHKASARIGGRPSASRPKGHTMPLLSLGQ